MTQVAEKLLSFLKNNTIVFDLSVLVIFYSLAHGLILLNHGVFWDDWVIYNVSDELNIDRLEQAGLPFFGYLFVMVSKGGVKAYRVVTFACYLLAAFFLFGILTHVRIDRFSRFFIVLFFMIFPVNNARISMSILPYSVCYALFFCGFWLTSLYVRNRNNWFRVVALSCLFFSFTTNSLLAFYLIIIVFLAYREHPPSNKVPDWLHLALRYADYLLLPVLFWIVKIMYLRPYGLYGDYNQVSFNGFKKAFVGSFRVFDTSFLTVINQASGLDFLLPLLRSLISVDLFIFLEAVAFVVALFFVCKILRDSESHQALCLFLFGGLAFWLAAFPYVSVGKIPVMEDFETRHQLLLPLGAALLLVYGTKLLVRSRIVMILVFVLLVSMFIHATVLDYITFQRDWYKQVSLMENMRKLPLMHEKTSFLFKDNSRDLNANYRLYRFYEYTGQMKEVFGDERRFGEESHTYVAGRKRLHDYAEFLNALYNVGDFVPREPDITVVISRGATSLSTMEILKLILLERYNKEKFLPLMSDIVRLNGG